PWRGTSSRFSPPSPSPAPRRMARLSPGPGSKPVRSPLAVQSSEIAALTARSTSNGSWSARVPQRYAQGEQIPQDVLLLPDRVEHGPRSLGPCSSAFTQDASHLLRRFPSAPATISSVRSVV